MKILVSFLVISFGIFVFFIRYREKREKQKMVGIEQDSRFDRLPFLQKVKKRAEEQAKYTEKSLHRVTFVSLAFLIPGGSIGVFLNNMELGLLLSAGLATIPFLYLLLLERKKQKIILKETVPLLTTLDWVYESNKSIAESLTAAKGSCPPIIKSQYDQMLIRIDSGTKPSVAINQLGDETRSPIFKFLAGIIKAQENRNDSAAFREALQELQKNVVKTNNRLAKVDSNLGKKKVFLLLMLVVSVILFWISFGMMDNPMAYFKSSEGANMLFIGTITMFIPFVIFMMSAMRRRF